MRFPVFLALAVILSVITTISIPATASPSSLDGNDLTNPENMNITYKNGLLSIFAQGVELDKVLFELSRKSGVEVIIEGKLGDEIFIRFDKLPLESGLKRLLKNQAYACAYTVESPGSSETNDTVLSRVTILQRPSLKKGSRERKSANANKPPTIKSTGDMLLPEFYADLSKQFSGKTRAPHRENLVSLENRINETVRTAIHRTDLMKMPDMTLLSDVQDTISLIKNQMDANMEPLETQMKAKFSRWEGMQKESE